MQVTSQASVNDDGQVSVSITIDGCTQPHPGTATRANSRSFALEVLTKQGDEGERAAVEWLRSKGWDVGKPMPGRQEAHDLAAKLNSMGGEKKPADKPDLPALYREAARWVRTISAMVSRPVPAFNSARDALIACAKADPDTADALRAYADVLTTLDGRALGAIADHLEKCARLAETAADVASPIKLATLVWEAINRSRSNEWTALQAHSYLRDLGPQTLLNTDLADLVKRYVAATTEHEWVVETIDEGSEGEVYMATFFGLKAEQRAREYAASKNTKAVRAIPRSA